MADDWVRAAAESLVARSCAAQGLAEKVRDVAVVSKVVTLLATDPHPTHGGQTVQTGATLAGSKRLKPGRPGATTT